MNFIILFLSTPTENDISHLSVYFSRLLSLFRSGPDISDFIEIIFNQEKWCHHHHITSWAAAGDDSEVKDGKKESHELHYYDERRRKFEE